MRGIQQYDTALLRGERTTCAPGRQVMIGQVKLTLATKVFTGLVQSAGDMTLLCAHTGLIQSAVEIWCCEEPASTGYHTSDIVLRNNLKHCLWITLSFAVGAVY